MSTVAQDFLDRLTAVKPNVESAKACQDEGAQGLGFRSRLSEMSTPVLVITGALDPTTGGGAFADDTATEIRGAELMVVEGVGHGLWFEAPDALRAEVAARLAN